MSKMLSAILVGLSVLLLIGWAHGATEEETKAAIAAKQAEIAVLNRLLQAPGSQRAVDVLNVMILADTLTTLVLNSVVVVVDSTDSMYVQIDVPLTSSTGMTLSFWKGWITVAPDLYDALPSTVLGRLRFHKGNADLALHALHETLK